MSLLDRVNDLYMQENRLHAVLMELTHACPCDCEHCFLIREPKDELTLTEVKDVLDQLAAEGAFNLGLTGGEVFLRTDLPEVLAAAHSHRFFVSILTTGVMVEQAEVDLLTRNGVRMAEVSLQGADASTHDAVMRFPGAFDRTINAIRLMRQAGIAVTIKTTLMKRNQTQLQDMATLAKSLSAHFSANISVCPQTDGDLTVQQLALNTDEVAALDPRLLSGGILPDEDFAGGAVLTCRAGKTVAGISPRGDVYPCILLPKSVGSLRQRSLKDIWHNNPDPFLSEFRGLAPEDSAECYSCDLQKHCRRCPGVTWMETGDPRLACPSACHGALGLSKATQRLSQK